MRIISGILAIIFVLGLAGCGGQATDTSNNDTSNITDDVEKTSEKTLDIRKEIYDIGLDILFVCDELLDDKIDAKAAYDKVKILDDKFNKFDKVNDMNNDEFSISTKGSMIISDLLAFKLAIMANSGFASAQEKILEDRNSLAERLGKETRK